MESQSKDSDDKAQEAEGYDLNEAEDEGHVLLGRTSSTKSTTSFTSKVSVDPHSVDTFWVQRQVSDVHPDPVTASSKPPLSFLSLA